MPNKLYDETDLLKAKEIPGFNVKIPHAILAPVVNPLIKKPPQKIIEEVLILVYPSLFSFL